MALSPSIEDLDKIRNPLAVQLLFGGFTFAFAGISPD